jgi:hypothetical protein
MGGGVFIGDLGFLVEAILRNLQHARHPFGRDGIGKIKEGL